MQEELFPTRPFGGKPWAGVCGPPRADSSRGGLGTREGPPREPTLAGGHNPQGSGVSQNTWGRGEFSRGEKGRLKGGPARGARGKRVGHVCVSPGPGKGVAAQRWCAASGRKKKAGAHRRGENSPLFRGERRKTPPLGEGKHHAGEFTTHERKEGRRPVGRGSPHGEAADAYARTIAT